MPTRIDYLLYFCLFTRLPLIAVPNPLFLYNHSSNLVFA
jgi:hypothetical protein